MIDSSEDKAIRATVRVETASGLVVEAELIDLPDHPLHAQVGYHRPPMVVPPNRATQQMWLEREPGPVAFSSIRLEGVILTFKRTRPGESE